MSGKCPQRCVVCGRPHRWYRHISTLSGRCAKCVARDLFGGAA